MPIKSLGATHCRHGVNCGSEVVFTFAVGASRFGGGGGGGVGATVESLEFTGTTGTVGGICITSRRCPDETAGGLDGELGCTVDD
jgi:hypothetical protein